MARTPVASAGDPAPVHLPSLEAPGEAPRAPGAALRGLGWMLLANVLFAAMSLAARGASGGTGWATVGMSRAAMGGLVALAFAWRRKAPLRTQRRGLSWARSAFGTVSMLATFYALSAKELPVGDAVTLLATAPIFIALLSGPILGERPPPIVWWVTGVAFVGIALIAGPTFAGGTLSAGVALLAAASSAIAMMFLRKMRSTTAGATAESVEAIALHFSLVSLVVHFLFAFPTLGVPTPKTALLLLLTGLSGGLAQLAMTRAYALTEAAKLGATSYVGTLLAQLGAVLLLHERPGARQLLGAAFVVGAGLTLAGFAARDARRDR